MYNFEYQRPQSVADAAKAVTKAADAFEHGSAQ